MAGYYYGRKKRYKVKYKNLALLLAIFLLVILLIGKGCSALFSKKDKPERENPSQTGDQDPGTPPDESGLTLTTDPTLQSSYIFTSVRKSESGLSEGDLVLVNNKIGFTGTVSEDDLVIVREKKNSSYSVKDNTVMVRPEVMDALNDMLLDFYTATGNDHILVNSGYRTPEYQQELYDDELAATGSDSSSLVAKPGYSEHYTGLAVDFTTDYYNQADIGKGDYKWINDNCYKYGFIVRYPEGKESLTMIDNEPWHYRYVGVAHATVMKNYDLCLEEYIDFIKNYSIASKKFLSVTTDDGSQYIIYYTPKSNGDYTDIYLPEINHDTKEVYPYEISGNNVDGWVVAFLYNQGTGVVVPETVPETSQDDVTSEGEPVEGAGSEE